MAARFGAAASAGSTRAPAAAPGMAAPTHRGAPPLDAFRLHASAGAAPGETPRKRRKSEASAPQDEEATQGLPEMLPPFPLRLVVVGHNPSETAWVRGHYYANPSNWMWRILRHVELAPAGVIAGCEDDWKMPALCGVGFTDVGTGRPGTVSANFSDADLREWANDPQDGFYARLARHAAEAGAPPHAVAFAGKRQFSVLFPGKRKVDVGRQAADALPPGWPLDPRSTSVWVMPSTSGASALTRAQRFGPWEELAEHVLGIPWEARPL